MQLILVLACAGGPTGAPSAEPPVCADDAVFFGVPSEATGLSDAECQPTCADCGGEPWTPPTYIDADFQAWRAWTLLDAPAPLAADPYAAAPPAEPGPDAVCAFHDEGQGAYRLHDHDSTAEALADGDQPTHYGACGLCSTLADLAVYASTPDLTAPVRDCGLAHLDGDVVALTDCIEALGFTRACASIWAYNTLHTRDACLAVCLDAVDDPYNRPDGSLNDCLQCDEDESGAVFKAYAGRTRRNTGLPSTICRPCGEVRPIEHEVGAP